MYVNPANAITFARFFSLPVFVWALQRGYTQWAVFAILYCSILDLFDGMAARFFNCASGFGEVLDAVADGLCYGFFLLVLGIYGKLPWLALGGLVAVGVINTVFRGVYAKRAARTTNYRSFAMERVVAFTAYLAAFGSIGFETEFFSYACLAVMTAVVIHDAKRMLIDPVPA